MDITCNKVTIPDTKNVVDMMSAVAGSSSLIQSSGEMTRGPARVPTNITKYCWNPNTKVKCQEGVDSMSYSNEDMVIGETLRAPSRSSSSSTLFTFAENKLTESSFFKSRNLFACCCTYVRLQGNTNQSFSFTKISLS